MRARLRRPTSSPSRRRGSRSGRDRGLLWSRTSPLCKLHSPLRFRIDKDEQANYSTERYFLAQVQSLPWKLAQTEVHGANRFTKGWFVVRAQRSDLLKMSVYGDRVYRLNPKPTVLQCGSFLELRSINLVQQGPGAKSTY